jgi:hypothetical protein
MAGLYLLPVLNGSQHLTLLEIREAFFVGGGDEMDGAQSGTGQQGGKEEEEEQQKGSPMTADWN